MIMTDLPIVLTIPAAYVEQEVNKIFNLQFEIRLCQQ
jgi:hypothetical protein